jgi:hypothetical protein
MFETRKKIKADREEMLSKMDAHHGGTEANHEKMIAKLDAHHEMMKTRVNGWREETKAE